MNKKHILIIGDVDSLKDYIDFFENNYSIITSTYESHFMPPAIKFAAQTIFTVDTPSYFDATCFENNLDIILDYTRHIIEQIGPIDRVVCTHEHTVAPAASIRTHFNIQGLKESEAILLRNKNKMKAAIEEFGLATPRFEPLNERTYEKLIDSFLNRFNKIVLKPADQAGSSDVLVTNNKVEAKQHAKNLLQTTGASSIEEFVEAPLMHFDGVIQNGVLQFFSVCKYVGNCYDFVHNRKSISTVAVNDPELYHSAKKYTERCLQALSIQSLVFHLEVFCSGVDEYVFLEIAGRYPGAGTTDLIKRAYGYDMVKASYDIDCINDVEVQGKSKLENNYAMVLIPSAIARTIQVVGIQGMDKVPNNVVGSEFFGPGTIVPYSSIDAFKPLVRFFVSDPDEERIRESIQHILNAIKVDYKEIQ